MDVQQRSVGEKVHLVPPVGTVNICITEPQPSVQEV